MYCMKSRKFKPYIYEALNTKDRLTSVTCVFNHTRTHFLNRKINWWNIFYCVSCARSRVRCVVLWFDWIGGTRSVVRNESDLPYGMIWFCLFSHLETTSWIQFWLLYLPKNGIHSKTSNDLNFRITYRFHSKLADYYRRQMTYLTWKIFECLMTVQCAWLVMIWYLVKTRRGYWKDRTTSFVFITANLFWKCIQNAEVNM